MGQDTYRLGRHRGRGWNWNWDIEGGRSRGMEEYKFARKNRERIITTPCMLLGKSFLFSIDLRRPEASNVTLSFSLLRSSCHFYFTCHRIHHFSHALDAFGHPRLFALPRWSSRLSIFHCVCCIFFSRLYGQIPHGTL